MYIQKKLNLIIQLILIQTLQLKCGSKFCEIYNFQISRTDNKFSYLINIYIYIYLSLTVRLHVFSFYIFNAHVKFFIN